MALLAAYTFMPWSGQIAVSVLIVAATPAVVLVGSWRTGGRTRTAWQLIAAGLTLFGVVDLIFDLHHVSLAGQSSVARLAYAIGYPLLLAGFVLLVAAVRGGWERGAVIEVGVMAIALMLVQIATTVAFAAAAVRPTVDFATTLVYALAGGILLACAEHSVVATIRRTPAFLALFLAVLALVVADDVYAAAQHADPVAASPNVIWLLSYVLFATAALTFPNSALPAESNPEPGLPVARLSSLGAALLALPALIVFSAVEALGGAMKIVLAVSRSSSSALVLCAHGLVGFAFRFGDELAQRGRRRARQRLTAWSAPSRGACSCSTRSADGARDDAFRASSACSRGPASSQARSRRTWTRRPRGSSPTRSIFLEPVELLIAERQLTTARRSASPTATPSFATTSPCSETASTRGAYRTTSTSATHSAPSAS